MLFKEKKIISNIIYTAICSLTLVLLLAIHIQAKSYYSNYYQCQSNLKNIATSLEMYAGDNNNLFPPSLVYLVPDYLELIPTCNESGISTISAGYQTTKDKKDFHICCIGNNHPELAKDQPAYDSQTGMVSNTYNTAIQNNSAAEEKILYSFLTLMGILILASAIVFIKK